MPQSSMIAGPRDRAGRCLVEDPARHSTARSSARWQASASSSGSSSKRQRRTTRARRRPRERPTTKGPIRPGGRSESEPVESDRRPPDQGQLGSHCLAYRPHPQTASPPPSAAKVCVPSKPLELSVTSSAVGGRLERDPDLDRDGQNQPAAVIGVLADQVHPAGSPNNSGTLRGIRHQRERSARSEHRPIAYALAVIETALFGATGHASSRVIFGAAALGSVSQDEADRTLELLLEYGINHIDTAASYGESELRLAPVAPRASRSGLPRDQDRRALLRSGSR